MSSHGTADQPSVLEVTNCHVDGCWCKEQGAILYKSATALLDNPKGGETTTPRVFMNTAREQFKGKTLCGRVRLMVQSLLIQWMSNYSDETLLVQDEYNKFGGEKAVGLSFQALKQKAQQGNGVVTPAGTASSFTTGATDPSYAAPSD